MSWANGCASSNFPDVYSRVSQAYDWIVSEVCKKSSDPPVKLHAGSSCSTFSQEEEFDDGNNGQDNGGNDA